MITPTWAGDHTPRFHDKTWCPQGHVMPVTAPTCPVCQNAVAVIASDLLEQLHLGLLPALEAPKPVRGEMPVFCTCGVAYFYAPGAVCPACSVPARPGMLTQADQQALGFKRCHTCGAAHPEPGSACERCTRPS